MDTDIGWNDAARSIKLAENRPEQMSGDGLKKGVGGRGVEVEVEKKWAEDCRQACRSQEEVYKILQLKKVSVTWGQAAGAAVKRTLNELIYTC